MPGNDIFPGLVNLLLFVSVCIRFPIVQGPF